LTDRLSESGSLSGVTSTESARISHRQEDLLDGRQGTNAPVCFCRGEGVEQATRLGALDHLESTGQQMGFAVRGTLRPQTVRRLEDLALGVEEGGPKDQVGRGCTAPFHESEGCVEMTIHAEVVSRRMLQARQEGVRRPLCFRAANLLGDRQGGCGRGSSKGALASSLIASCLLVKGPCLFGAIALTTCDLDSSSCLGNAGLEVAAQPPGYGPIDRDRGSRPIVGPEQVEFPQRADRIAQCSVQNGTIDVDLQSELRQSTDRIGIEQGEGAATISQVHQQDGAVHAGNRSLAPSPLVRVALRALLDRSVLLRGSSKAPEFGQYGAEIRPRHRLELWRVISQRQSQSFGQGRLGAFQLAERLQRQSQVVVVVGDEPGLAAAGEQPLRLFATSQRVLVALQIDQDRARVVVRNRLVDGILQPRQREVVLAQGLLDVAGDMKLDGVVQTLHLPSRQERQGAECQSRKAHLLSWA